MKKEVKLDSCKKDQIPVLRRISGGGTVLLGPGCLNYSLILKNDNPSAFGGISKTNCLVLNRHREALSTLIGPVEIRGQTDLVLGKLKFSGNAQRRKKTALLYHGTFLLNFKISLIEKYLEIPSRQPTYRQNRPHSSFLANLNLEPARIKERLTHSWQMSSRAVQP